MFDILNLLPAGSWFPEPSADGVFADVCSASGHLAGPDCPSVESVLLPAAALESAPCPYHKGGVFALPPSMEWYYRPHHPEYVGVSSTSDAVMEFIYPSTPGSLITLPKSLSGTPSAVVFRVAHRIPSTTIWWHLDGSYVGETKLIHELSLLPASGKHILTVVDATGETLATRFEVK